MTQIEIAIHCRNDDGSLAAQQRETAKYSFAKRRFMSKWIAVGIVCACIIFLSSRGRDSNKNDMRRNLQSDEEDDDEIRLLKGRPDWEPCSQGTPPPSIKAIGTEGSWGDDEPDAALDLDAPILGMPLPPQSPPLPYHYSPPSKPMATPLAANQIFLKSLNKMAPSYNPPPARSQRVVSTQSAPASSSKQSFQPMFRICPESVQQGQRIKIRASETPPFEIMRCTVQEKKGDGDQLTFKLQCDDLNEVTLTGDELRGRYIP